MYKQCEHVKILKLVVDVIKFLEMKKRRDGHEINASFLLISFQ